MAWDYLTILWRRKVYVIVPFLIGIFVSAFLILYLPKIYQSNTLILVEAQKVPEAIVQSAVTGTVEGRLSTIRQQILSRSFLTRLIDKYSLYQASRPTLFQNAANDLGLKWLDQKSGSVMSKEAAIAHMRNSIDVKTIGKREISAFTITFKGTDPTITMNVTNELASLFIEENLKIREQLVQGTTIFLNNELNNLKEVLERQEREIGDFKRKYMGELPEQLDSNLRSLDRFQSDLLSIQFTKRSNQDRINFLESALKEIKRKIGEGPLDIPFNNSSSTSDSILLPIELELKQSRRRLTSLLLEFKKDYPDVQILRHQIQELESQLSLSRSNPGIREIPFEENEILSSISPSARASIIDLEHQIKNTKTEFQRIEKQEIKLRKQITRYEKRVENVPAREQELAILLRDYGNMQKNYQRLLDKKLNAKISENLEKKQKGEKFHIIDLANFPEKPIKPNRQKIGLFGIFLGLGGGIALVFVREQFDSSLHKPEDIEKIISVPLLASIPDFTDEMRKG